LLPSQRQTPFFSFRIGRHGLFFSAKAAIGLGASASGLGASGLGASGLGASGLLASGLGASGLGYGSCDGGLCTRPNRYPYTYSLSSVSREAQKKPRGAKEAARRKRSMIMMRGMIHIDEQHANSNPI